MIGGTWFRIRQIFIFLLILTTLIILWKSMEKPSFTTFAPISLAMACNIPKLDINGSEVIQFFKAATPLNCHIKNAINWAYVDDDGHFALIPEKKGASCLGRSFTRIDDTNLAKADPVALIVGHPLPSDYVSVECNLDGATWSGLLMTVVANKSLTEKLANVTPPDDSSHLNVFFLGLDSLSQMSFRRKLPKTVDFLENVLGSVVLNGYNIVGDGTPQAFIPILTGSTELELPLTRKRFPKAQYVDDAYPFVWRNFSDAGYATMYAEDAAAIGTFTYRLKGFHHQPTDHYTRTFFQLAEKVLNDMKCLGSEPLHKTWLRYSREFMREYSPVPRFLLMHHSMLSHDDINLIGVIDDDLSSHLQRLYAEGTFDNALVVVMADHGHRFAKLRNTHQGQLEERLPFFSLALPKAFRESDKGKQAWANLQVNADRLTTPFDIHATLLDIIHWPKDFSTVQDATAARSLSLWKPIAASRTCGQAGVEPHWCTCLDWHDAMDTEQDKDQSMRIAEAIVSVMNEQTSSERALCAPLKLNKVYYSKRLTPNNGLLAYKSVKDTDGFVPDLSGTTKPAFAHYQLKLSTTPGRAIYEVTVVYHMNDKRLDIDLGSISHVNKFGEDPHCIIDKNYFLATYCVCYDRLHSED